MNCQPKNSTRPYVCELCGREMWSLSEVVMFWDYFYCRACDPDTRVEGENEGENDADPTLLEGWDG